MSFTTYMDLPMPAKDDRTDPSERGWMSAHCAPMNIPMLVRVRDEHGPYTLKSKVMLVVDEETGKTRWRNVEKNTWIVVPVHQWKYHPDYVPERKKPRLMPK